MYCMYERIYGTGIHDATYTDTQLIYIHTYIHTYNHVWCNRETDPSFPDKHDWPDYFHMPVLMLMLITALNDGTLIAIG